MKEAIFYQCELCGIAGPNKESMQSHERECARDFIIKATLKALEGTSMKPSEARDISARIESMLINLRVTK
jgi:hypothetical protein